MKKRIFAMAIATVMLVSLLTGCTDSSKQTVIKKTDYDAAAEVKKFKLNELSEEEKNYTVEMGYNNCDHMVASLIGQHAGIYDALGLKVNITKTGKIMEAMASGEMDTGYQGIKGAIRSVNNGAQLFMAAANHLGGSRYLVVGNNIKEPKDLLGKNLAIGAAAAYSPEWFRYADELGIPRGLENYKVVDMAQADACFALKAGQIDGFICCDPYASQAEFEGFGHVVATGWGAHVSEDKTEGWGMCCVYCMSNEFPTKYPELARRLIIAHTLATEYLYSHPYNAAMMFAEGFGTAPDVGLRTVYMKTVAEGRTLTWEFDEENLKNYEKYYTDYAIPEKETPSIKDISKFISVGVLDKGELDSFDTFISEKIDPVFPVGMTYSEWLAKAKIIDGVSEEDKTGEFEKWMKAENKTAMN